MHYIFMIMIFTTTGVTHDSIEYNSKAACVSAMEAESGMPVNAAAEIPKTSAKELGSLIKWQCSPKGE